MKIVKNKQLVIWIDKLQYTCGKRKWDKYTPKQTSGKQDNIRKKTVEVSRVRICKRLCSLYPLSSMLIFLILLPDLKYILLLNTLLQYIHSYRDSRKMYCIERYTERNIVVEIY